MGFYILVDIMEFNSYLVYQFLNGAKDDLLTSYTYLSLSFTLFLRDSISANNITNNDKCSWILFTKAA